MFYNKVDQYRPRICPEIEKAKKNYERMRVFNDQIDSAFENNNNIIFIITFMGHKESLSTFFMGHITLWTFLPVLELFGTYFQTF